jgi:hypothetical protein
VCKFISDVFYGRLKVQKQRLFALAAAKGVSKKALTTAMKDLGFKSKRVGRGHGAIWNFINPDPDASSQLRLISNKELEAAVEGEQESAARETENSEDSSGINDSNYYDL